jgi:hypothetical protein
MVQEYKAENANRLPSPSSQNQEQGASASLGLVSTFGPEQEPLNEEIEFAVPIAK